MEGFRPSLVIGVDFGMTCTAVAWSSDPEWPEPKVIQRWPRRKGQIISEETADKVPTLVSYSASGTVVNWGFDDFGGPEVEIQIEREFKLYLDPTFRDNYADSPTHQQAVKYYKDFMTSLYRYIHDRFQNMIGAWDHINIEYLFSIPTTWKSFGLTARMEEWLAEAGFRNSHNRKVRISQTEAEAAAVYAAKQKVAVGDVIMVVDAGGATTDINVLKLIERSKERTRLQALTKAEGVNVGSTLIDQRVKELIIQKLIAMKANRGDEPIEWLADDLMKEYEFEAFKCAVHGTSTLDFFVTVPQAVLPHGRGRVDQRLVIKAGEIKQSFDNQINSMFLKMKDQIAEFERKFPHDKLKYIILSGGLGSSRYVKSRIEDEFAKVPGGLQVLFAPEPQLAVAKGLVMDRAQALSQGTGVYTGKCSRTSFGMLCRLPYDKNLHRGEQVHKDPLDNLVWVENQIDWLIKEGEAVPEEGFLRPYRIKIPKGSEYESFAAHFVKSESPSHDLPRSLRLGNAQISCTVSARLAGEDFKRASANVQRVRGGILGLSSKNEHYIAEVNLKVVVGTTDLRFEILSKDGRKYTQNDGVVSVQWQEVAMDQKLNPNTRNPYPVMRSIPD